MIIATVWLSLVPHAPPKPDTVEATLSSALKMIRDPGNVIANGADYHGKGLPKVSPQLKKAVLQNPGVMPLLAKATKMEWRPDLQGAKNFPVLAQVKAVTKFARTAGDVACSDGKFSEAVADYEIAFRLGTQLMRKKKCDMVTGLVGIACEAIARRSISRAGPFFKPKDQLALAGMLGAAPSQRVPFHAVMAADFNQQLDLMPEDANRAPRKEREKAVQFFKAERILFDALLVRYKRPFAKRGSQPRFDPKFKTEFEEIYGGETPTNDLGWVSFLSCDVDDSLVSLKLATLAYRSTHGSWPKDFRALGRVAPPDPFAVNKPLQMVRKGDQIIFYSVGPDGKDDHGHTLNTSRATIGSKGDMILIVDLAPKQSK